MPPAPIWRSTSKRGARLSRSESRTSSIAVKLALGGGRGERRGGYWPILRRELQFLGEQRESCAELSLPAPGGVLRGARRRRLAADHAVPRPAGTARPLSRNLRAGHRGGGTVPQHAQGHEGRGLHLPRPRRRRCRRRVRADRRRGHVRRLQRGGPHSVAVQRRKHLRRPARRGPRRAAGASPRSRSRRQEEEALQRGLGDPRRSPRAGAAGAGAPPPPPPPPAPPRAEGAARVFWGGPPGPPGAPADSEPVLRALRAALSVAPHPVVAFLGDNIYPRGMPDSSAADRPEAERRLTAQLRVLGASGARGIFVPGNHDWDRHGPGGWDAVRREERFIAAAGGTGAALLPAGGGPGPPPGDLGQGVRPLGPHTQRGVPKRAQAREP